MGGLFGPEFLSKLAMDSRTRPLMSDPEFQAILKDVQSDPMGSMQKYMKNPKFQTAMSVSFLLPLSNLLTLPYRKVNLKLCSY